MSSNVRFSCCINLFFIFIFVFLLTIVVANKYQMVETKSGRVRGIRKESLLKKMGFYAFKSIPYAKPPIGELRFKV